ncbi:hypothetical protein [Chitinophaga sp. 22620]|uniref:hypothetical protein n=1 Tax=Chitinophaga sp. 22620 TaxID=3453952 RepID=UPI003F867BB8
MKQIKLAVLAVGLLAGFAGAYGQATINYYWVDPGTPKNALTAIISATPPSPSCSGSTSYPYICRIASTEPYSVDDEVWITEVTIESTYNQ